MFCAKCGNKIPANTLTCKFCGYEMSEDDDEEVAKIKVVPTTKNHPITKDNTRSINNNNGTINKIFLILAVVLILTPFILIPLAYAEYKLTLFFVVSCIMGIFVQLLGIYLTNNLCENKNRLLKAAKYGIYLSAACLAFTITFVAASTSMNSDQLIDKYQNLLVSLISISVLSLVYTITSKLLIKYS